MSFAGNAARHVWNSGPGCFYHIFHSHVCKLTSEEGHVSKNIFWWPVSTTLPFSFSLSSSCLLPPVSLSQQFCLFFALSLLYLSLASVFCSLCHFQYQSLPLSLVFHLSIFPLSPKNKHCTLDIWQYHSFLVVKIIISILANYSVPFVSSFTHIVMILKSTITN